MDFETWSISLAAAAAGALLGGIATWAAQRRLDHRKEKSEQFRRLEANVHRLDLRMTKLETEMDVVGFKGRRQAADFESEAQHDDQE